MLSEHSDSEEEDHAVCKFLSNSLLCMLWTYNGKDSINWFWFGSFWNVRLAYKVHYSWWTTHTTSDQWKWCKLFLPCGTLFQEVTKEKGSGFCRIKERRKYVAPSILLQLKLGNQMLHQHIIQTAWNCVALMATGVHTNPQKDAATNPPIQGRKNTIICIQE